MRGFLKVISTSLLLLTVALVSALVTMRLAVHGREVEVPDVRGKTPLEAHHIADDLWMSTAYERDSVAIHFTWKPDWLAVSKLLPEIERELAPFEPRPHWGKLFTMPPQQLRSKYERLAEFVALAKKFDPSGKFRNRFLKMNIFG